MDLAGFHVFAGSQNLNADVVARPSARPSTLFSAADAMPSPVEYINLGGRFGIPYFEKDRPLDLTVVGVTLPKC